ncbi:eCIS core domain-containing protein [Polaribacter sp.]|uniref:eCIS core domain-containing protein n=1 Tax=Polaribacter sp. TaxID=1920175 RepID=UPI003EF4F91D
MRRLYKKPKAIQAKENGMFLKPAIQTKLNVGKPGDKYEVEADKMADQVVKNKGNEATIQKKEGDEDLQAKPLAASVTPLLQKMATSEDENAQAKLQKKEEEEAVQTKEEEESVQMMEEEEAVQAKEEESVQMMEEEEAVQSKEEEESVQMMEEEEAVQAKEEEEVVQAKINSRKQQKPNIEQKLKNGSGGKKMDGNTRAKMEQGFGADFSAVNIHTDSDAVQLNEDIGAQAFTHGNDVYFNKGKYNPNSTEGSHLLAHELTHTIQQTGMVQTYRGSGATNFGVGNSSSLKEDSFNPKTDKITKPWIHKIYVNLNKKTVKDSNGVDTYKGSLVAKYFDNKHKLSDITFPVTAGSTEHMSSEANHLVHRIEGPGYMSSDYSEPYTPNPKNSRYNQKPEKANMHFAIFYKGAQAVHGGLLNEASHGCLHVADFSKLKQLNYHSVKGLTAVIVKYV